MGNIKGKGIIPLRLRRLERKSGQAIGTQLKDERNFIRNSEEQRLAEMQTKKNEKTNFVSRTGYCSG